MVIMMVMVRRSTSAAIYRCGGFGAKVVLSTGSSYCGYSCTCTGRYSAGKIAT